MLARRTVNLVNFRQTRPFLPLNLTSAARQSSGFPRDQHRKRISRVPLLFGIALKQVLYRHIKCNRGRLLLAVNGG